jgi:spore germination protein YaaH
MHKQAENAGKGIYFYMKKKLIPVLIVIGLIALIVAGLVISSYIKKYTPTTERADLEEYFASDSPDAVPIVWNYSNSKFSAKQIDGQLYLDFSFVHDMLNSRFYWDANEELLFYATPTELLTITPGESSYLKGDTSVDFGSAVACMDSGTVLIHIDFAAEFCDFTYSYYDSPSRIVMQNQWGTVTTVSAAKNTVIRQKGGIKSPILCDLAGDVSVTVLDEEENWTKVMTDDGIAGYVQKKYLNEETTATVSHEFEEEQFSHIQKDFEICMAWHQVFSQEANSEIASVLAATKSVNVISPTWFYLNDNEGNLSDIGSIDYVNYCHEQGVEVWALFSNLENTEVDTAYVLTHSSLRHHLVDEMIAKAIQYDLDGINLDFESMSQTDVGEAYIQFVRELSLKCAENGIVLSIDNYVPSDYTAFYDRAEQANFADYVVIMGYDEHYAGSDAGSVASLGWVEEGVTNTLSEVPAEQIILGMPFYTRVWSLTPVSDESDTEMKYDVKSEAYGMSAANKLVAANNAEKQWLADCGQYFVEYEKAGTLYRIWLEDAESLEKRLQLLDEYALAGASFWKLGLETSDIWDTVAEYIP